MPRTEELKGQQGRELQLQGKRVLSFIFSSVLRRSIHERAFSIQGA